LRSPPQFEKLPIMSARIMFPLMRVQTDFQDLLLGRPFWEDVMARMMRVNPSMATSKIPNPVVTVAE
jgi:hypothetical protein